jgi:hypothetical protein
MKSVYVVPSAGLRSLIAINVHQVTAGKQLKSHDEQLMLIIPVSAVTIRVGIEPVA